MATSFGDSGLRPAPSLPSHPNQLVSVPHSGPEGENGNAVAGPSSLGAGPAQITQLPLTGLSTDASIAERISGLNLDDEADNGDYRPEDTSEMAYQPVEAVEGENDRVQLDGMWYRQYRSEAEDLDNVIRLVEAELSEPYNLYTFRYFLIEWPHLAYLVYSDAETTRAVGVIVCKTDTPLYGRKKRGYVAMLSIEPGFRRKGIASHLVKQCLLGMQLDGVREVVIETESDNSSSLALYERLGFTRDKRLHRFYSNGKDAYRLILPLDPHTSLFPKYTSLFPSPSTLRLPCSLPFTSTSKPHDPESNEYNNDDAYSETASEVSFGRWEAASGPEWLETLDEHEAWLRGLGGEPGRPEPAPEGAQWMLGDLLRERAEAEVRASQVQASQEGRGGVNGIGQEPLLAQGGTRNGDAISSGEEGEEREGREGEARPDTPALRKPVLPPRPEQGHVYDGMYI